VDDFLFANAPLEKRSEPGAEYGTRFVEDNSNLAKLRFLILKNWKVGETASPSLAFNIRLFLSEPIFSAHRRARSLDPHCCGFVDLGNHGANPPALVFGLKLADHS
jgi:hypothetical protein